MIELFPQSHAGDRNLKDMRTTSSQFSKRGRLVQEILGIGLYLQWAIEVSCQLHRTVPSDEAMTALGCPCTIADSIAIDFVTWEGVDMTWSYGRYVDVSPPRVALANGEGFARGAQLDLLRSIS